MAAGLAALATLGLAASAQAKVQYAWVQDGAAGVPVVRAVIPSGACPALRADGRRLAMDRRAERTAAQPTVVCSRRVARSTASVTIADPVRDWRFDLAQARAPKRIVVVGDTGCVIEKGFVQDCNDPAQWPFQSVAAHAARTRPDLVLHIGDLLYREVPCPAGDAACAGSPTGNTYATLRADFFAPALPLLVAAPWVMVRGNHETCALDGPAWYRYFGLDGTTCQAYPPPYDLPLGGGLGLVVHDSAEADYDATSASQIPLYARQFRQASALGRRYRRSWMTTHQPPFGIDGMPGGQFYDAGNATLLPAALRGGGLTGFDTILSGHQHLLQVLQFAGRRPSQLTIGNGGASLDNVFTTDVLGTEIGGLRVSAGLVSHEWGYTVLDRRGTAWRMTAHGVDGRVLVRCTLTGQRAPCTPA